MCLLHLRYIYIYGIYITEHRYEGEPPSYTPLGTWVDGPRPTAAFQKAGQQQCTKMYAPQASGACVVLPPGEWSVGKSRCVGWLLKSNFP